jgi:hypothetical protein
MSSAQPPSEFVCPLTKKLMKEPMMSRYGNHFERAEIMNWLNKGHTYCPLTGNPLRPSNLVSNKTLQWKINYWAKKHGEELGELQSRKGEESIGFVAVPQEKFLCALTHKVMKDPVMTREGNNFERKAILQWLDERCDICPITGKPLRVSGIVANRKLQWEIRQWQLNEGDASREMTRLELENKLSKPDMVSRDSAFPDILRALTMQDAFDPPVVEPVGKKDVLSVLDDVMSTL